MGFYIFRMPKDTPELTHETLDAYIGPTRNRASIGATVSVYRWAKDNGLRFELYWTTLAVIYPGRVEFTTHGDTHGATREWLQKIATDNGIGQNVWRDRSYQRDGFRYPGKLIIDGDRNKPVEGRAYPTHIAERRQRDADNAARLAEWNAKQQARSSS